MYISNNRYRLAELNYDNLETSAKLLAQVFLTLNKVWATINPTLEQVHQFMLAKTREMLDWQQQLRDTGIISRSTYLNFVYLDENDKIIGVWTNFELSQYLSKTSSVYLPHFQILENYGLELEKSIDPQHVVPGLSIYAMFSGMDPKVMGTGAIVNFWADMTHYMHGQGFRFMYGRCSNIKSHTLALRVGASLLSQIKGNANGKEIDLSFVLWILEPFYNQQWAKQKQKPML